MRQADAIARHTVLVSPDRRGYRSLALFATVFLGSGLAFALVYVATVRTAQGRLVADASLRGAVLTGSRTGEVVDRILSVVSVASLLAAVAIIAMIALIRLSRSAGLAAVSLLVAANVAAQILKHTLPRPDFGLAESSPATLNSMPSGHSTAAFSVVVALLLVAHVRARRPLALAGGAYAIVTGVATMAAGWHRAADSLAAYFLVGALAAVAVGVLVILDGPREVAPRERPQGRNPDRSWMVLAATILVIALGSMTVLGNFDSIRESTFGQGLAFFTGGLFVVSSVIAILLVVLAMIERLDYSAGDYEENGTVTSA